MVPRRHDADFARASDRDIAATAEALRQVLGRLAASLDGPPYNLVLHTAPLKEQVDATYHWHWEIHPRLREIAGLELGTGLPVNPVSPGGRRGRAPARVRAAARRSIRSDDGTGGGGRHTVADRASSQGPGAPRSDRGATGRSRTGAPVVADPFELEQRRTPARGPHRERRLGSRRGVPLRRGAVREAPARDLRVPGAHAA